MCISKERKFWMSINAKYMSQEESDEAEDDVLIKSRPVWHLEGTRKRELIMVHKYIFYNSSQVSLKNWTVVMQKVQSSQKGVK